MNWKVLKTEEDYSKASIRMMEIFHAEVGSADQDELELLTVLIQDFDEKHCQLPELDALAAIKYKMEEMNIKQKDLEGIVGSKGHVSAILSGKREITLKMAKQLKNFFNLPSQVFIN